MIAKAESDVPKLDGKGGWGGGGNICFNSSLLYDCGPYTMYFCF